MNSDEINQILIDAAETHISQGSFEQVIEFKNITATFEFSLATGAAWNSKEKSYKKIFVTLPKWLFFIHPLHRTRICDIAISNNLSLPPMIDDRSIEIYLSKIRTIKTNSRSKEINEYEQFNLDQNLENHSRTKKSEEKDTSIVDEIEKYYLDRIQLSERGWTRTLIERFLTNPDRWATVNHWRNYTGKATYFIERVVAAEQLNEFKKVFEASIVRRGLTKNDLRSIKRKRSKLDTLYRSWVKTLSPEDIQHMLLVDSMTEEFESARAQGYRTPHK
jgi:hypothetical protein